MLHDIGTVFVLITVLLIPATCILYFAAHHPCPLVFVIVPIAVLLAFPSAFASAFTLLSLGPFASSVVIPVLLFFVVGIRTHNLSHRGHGLIVVAHSHALESSMQLLLVHISSGLLHFLTRNQLTTRELLYVSLHSNQATSQVLLVSFGIQHLGLELFCVEVVPVHDALEFIFAILPHEPAILPGLWVDCLSQLFRALPGEVLKLESSHRP
mmetsp:Transcript_57979/g.138037  ORF Transcript_57979/g.138037 Transcript_57979/m.138037 type:complete len:211 (+) Transcript_57979:292-924(+)